MTIVLCIKSGCVRRISKRRLAEGSRYCSRHSETVRKFNTCKQCGRMKCTRQDCSSDHVEMCHGSWRGGPCEPAV